MELQRVTAEELQKMLELLRPLFDSAEIVECGGEPANSADNRPRLRSHPMLLETPEGERSVALELTRGTEDDREEEIAREVWDKVYRDDLTRAYNRRYLNEFRFLKGTDSCRLGLILLDLRKFKQVNDTLGHAAGDEILMQVTETLMAHQRGEDAVVRFGGDEFVLLFPGMGEQAVQERICQLRAALEKVASADFGYAWMDEFRPERTLLRQLLDEADQRMYAEKQGRL